MMREQRGQRRKHSQDPLLTVDIGSSQVRWARSGARSSDRTSTGEFAATVYVRGEEVLAPSECEGLNPADLHVVEQPARSLGRSTVVVDDVRVPASLLVAAVLREAVAQSGAESPQIILVHPARWSPGAVGEARQAALDAGFPASAVTLTSTPVAVAGDSSGQLPVTGTRCLVLSAGRDSSEVSSLRESDGRWIVETCRDAPGTDRDVAGVVQRYRNLLPESGCPVIISGEGADDIAPALVPAAALEGLPGASPVRVATDPAYAAVRGAVRVGADQSLVRRRRGLRAAVAVLGVTVVAGVLVVVTRPAGTALADYAPEAPAERLASFIGEEGQFDCRTLYDQVPAGTLLNAGFDFDQSGELADKVRDGLSGGQRGCELAYAGDYLGPMHREVAGFPLADTVLIQFRTGAEKLGDRGLQNATEHRGWRLATRDVSVPGDPDGKTIPIRTADIFVPGRGMLAFFLGLDDPHSDVDTYGHPETPIDIDAAFRQIIDAFEDMNRIPVDPEDPPVIGESAAFTCSSLYDRTSLRYLQDHRFFLADGYTRYLDGNGDQQREAVPRYDRDGRERCTGWFEGGGTTSAVDISTGASDGLPGYPVVDADDLDGWEEYWAFAPALPAASSNQDGIPTYNLRHCQGDGDHCITLTAYELLSLNNSVSTPAELKERVLPVARILNGTDTSDSASDSADPSPEI